MVVKGLIKKRLVPFLGHIVSSGDIKVDIKKIEVVKNWPRHVTPVDIHNFWV